MNPCYRCHNDNFTIIENCVGCNRCKRIIFERKINRKNNKNKHLITILREFNHFQPYKTQQLINEIYTLCILDNSFEITPKSIKLFLKQRNHTHWIFYYQFLNKIHNIDFKLSFEDKNKITLVFNKYLHFKNKNVSYKKLLPMIFKYLNINFYIKPDYDDDFLTFISQTNSDKSVCDFFPI